VFERGVLSARVLIPRDDDFVELPTVTAVKAVHSKDTGRVPIDSSSDISTFGLVFGDLVTVLLAGRDDEFAKLLPESGGWIAFIIGKNRPVYSLREGGWLMDKKYEL
jgi:hypothetical protein